MAASTAIIYNGERLIPAPQISFSRTHRRSGDQSIIGTEHQVTLSGTLVACKGWDFSSGSPVPYTGSDYPADDTSCDKFPNLVEMQEQIRSMFDMDKDYGWLEVVGCNGLIRKWRARTLSIDFPEGQWTDVAPYTVTLGLQTDYITDDDLHTDHSESWDVQWDEESGGIYTLNHTLSCSSEEFGTAVNTTTDGWNQAKAWVDARLSGADYTAAAPNNVKNSIVTDGLDVALGTDYTAYNYTVQRSLDEYGGSYSVTETWTLAKDPVFRTWSVATSKSRDDYTNVTVDGEFRSLLDRTTSTEDAPTNGSAAFDAYTIWDEAGGPFAAANGSYNGCTSLGTCPVNKNVTITEESRGDDSQAYGEATRTVGFSYEFSDSPSTADVSISRGEQISNIETCETRVTISIKIQGHECDCDATKIDNARTAYGLISCATEAANVYSGSGNLRLVNSNYTENERDGTIDSTCEFSDKFVGGFITDERISVGWTCGDLKTDGTTKTTYSVDGSIKGTCDGDMPTAPSTGDYNCYGDSCCTLRRQNIVRDTINKTISYTYEYDNDCGPGLVEISVDRTNGPDDCGNWITSVDMSVQGVGCTSNEMLTNAFSALNSINPDTYAPEGSCRTALRENKNVTRGTIQQTYTYTTECDATLNVTTTDTFDAAVCDDSAHSVEGEIKGHCYVGGGAMGAAEALYAEHLPAVYANGDCLISSRVSRNDKSGTISFNYEFRSCPEGYDHEQSITVKEDDSNCCSDVSISGSITPFCDADTGVAGQIETAEEAWVEIEAGLAADAGDYCGTTVVLRGTSVTRNRGNGQIQYSYTYTCCNNSIEGVLKESVNITREFPSDVVAIIPILGRSCGPLVQDKGTKTIEKCSIAINLLYPKNCSTYSKPSGLEDAVQGIIDAAGCCTGAYGTYQERDTESWNPRSGQYTRNVSFICECCDED